MSHGKLSILREVARRNGQRRFLCRCACGVELIVLRSNLRSGNSTSCGCVRLENLAKRNTKHGQAPRGKTSAEYKAWKAMIQRCQNPQNPNWPDYGARGIRVCESWSEFKVFLTDMGKRPSARHSLDRVDNNKGYEPRNCRWATKTQQSRNQRSNRVLAYKGVTRTVAGWAQVLGIKASTISSRLQRGWSVTRALGTPVSSRGNQ